MTDRPAVISFIAPSGTGKTTYLETLIPALVARGLRVGAIKHDAHSFQMDREGKDTARLRAAGCSRVAIGNDREIAVYGDAGATRSLPALVALLGDVDLAIVEGYREADVPKVVLARRGAPQAPYDATSPGVVAVVADHPQPGGHPHFALDDPNALAAFLVERFGL